MIWDFIVAPNSAHPPHIGHVASVMHARGQYLATKALVARHKLPNVTCRWGLVHDLASLPEYEATQLRLLEWLGYPPEFEVRLRDYAALSDDIMCYLLKMDRRVLDLSQTKVYLMLALASVRTHVRGWDLVDREDGERSLAGMFGLPFPTIRYAPVLVTDNGEKICSSQPDHERFRVDFQAHSMVRLTGELMDLITPEHQGQSPMPEVVRVGEQYLGKMTAADRAAYVWYHRIWQGGLLAAGLYAGCAATPVYAESFAH